LFYFGAIYLFQTPEEKKIWEKIKQVAKGPPVSVTFSLHLMFMTVCLIACPENYGRELEKNAEKILCLSYCLCL
jgi:hypothetical protein